MLISQKNNLKKMEILNVEKILNSFGNLDDDGKKLCINDLEKYKHAFIHKSCCHDEHHLNSYERFEFLGDAFISSIVAKYLIDRFKDQPEGFLTKVRSKLVRTNMLSRFCEFFDMDKHIITADDVRITDNIKEDCFEAFIGAIIQDYGEKGMFTLNVF